MNAAASTHVMDTASFPKQLPCNLVNYNLVNTQLLQQLSYNITNTQHTYLITKTNTNKVIKHNIKPKTYHYAYNCVCASRKAEAISPDRIFCIFAMWWTSPVRSQRWRISSRLCRLRAKKECKHAGHRSANIFVKYCNVLIWPHSSNT